MKKQEKINLEEFNKIQQTTPKIDFDNIDLSTLYTEHIKKQEKPQLLKMSSKLTAEEKFEFISQKTHKFNDELSKLLHHFFFLKLYSRAAKKSPQFNQDLLNLDRYVNNLKREYEDAKRMINVFKKYATLSDEKIQELFTKISDVYDYHRELADDLKQLQAKYYPTLKMSAYTLANEKKYFELERLSMSVSKELLLYKSLEEAFDYYCYNSGELINELVNLFVELPRKVKIDVDYHYFLQSDAIINFRYTDWVELYSKFMYMKKRIGNTTLYTKKFRDLFEQFEIRYAIVLIYNEFKHQGR